jgi:hypothetical protein
MSPTNTNINNPNGSGFNNSNVRVSSTDLRCRRCGHNRSKCSIYQTPRSHSSAADRRRSKKVPKACGKVYCCKCKPASKSSRYFDPDHEEKLGLIKYTGLKIDAAARLRSYILKALKSGRRHDSLTTCSKPSRLEFGHDHGSAASHYPSLAIFNCQLPEYTQNDVLAANSLDRHVQQVYNNVRRLIVLLSNETPIDTGILRTILSTLFDQLAILIHRAFPTLVPRVLTNRKAFQHSLRIARRGTQAAYKQLCAVALEAGMMMSSRERATSAGWRDGLDTLITAPGRRSVLLGCAAGAQQLLWRSRELADELHFWLALLRAGRDL